MTKRAPLLLLLAGLVLPAAAQPHSTAWDARLTAVQGQVRIYPSDDAQPVSGEEGALLEEGDRVVVSSGATAEIALDGGSLITLGESSDFTLSKLSRAQAEFRLTLGSLLAKIQKLGNDRLQVRTPAAVAAVRGTEFGVDAEDGQQSRVGVFDEGQVEVRGLSGAAETLTPNQETSVRQGYDPSRPAPLQRFAGRREAMRAQVRRLDQVRKGWKALPPAQRRRMRRQALARQRRNDQHRRQPPRHRQPTAPERRRRQKPGSRAGKTPRGGRR